MVAIGRGKALVYAIVAALAGGVAYVCGVRSDAGQRAEDAVLRAAEFSTDPAVPLSLVSPANVVIALGVIGIIAWVFRGFVRMVWILLFSGAALVASQLLKDRWLDRPTFDEVLTDNTFPSGHMVVFGVLVIATLWAVPAGARGVLALVGAVLLGVVSWELLAYAWHRPSDLLGAQALCVLVFSIAALFRVGRRGRGPGRAARGLDVVAGAMLTIAGFALVIGGAAVVAAGMSNSNDALLLSGSQLALVGTSAFVARAGLALGR